MTTEEQLDRFNDLEIQQWTRLKTVQAEVAARYPDDEGKRRAAVNAAVRDLLSEHDTVAEAGKDFADARKREALMSAAARQVAILAIEDGATEAATARAMGVDRRTVRKWIGKPR